MVTEHKDEIWMKIEVAGKLTVGSQTDVQLAEYRFSISRISVRLAECRFSVSLTGDRTGN